MTVLTKGKKRIEINEETPRVLICCYGTLRRGEGNYYAILHKNSEFLGTYETEPIFTMYGRNKGFPIVVDKGETSIQYDVFAIIDPNILNRLHHLEGCTGVPRSELNWYDIKQISTPVGTAYIYVMHTEGDPEGVISSGNWLDR